MNRTWLRKASQVFACLFWLCSVLALLLTGCQSNPGAAATPVPQVAGEITLYSWAEYMPQAVMDAFTEETGVKINYIAYETQDEAEDNLRAGESYDLALMPPETIPGLIEDNLLAEFDRSHITNFKNISANFRDLAFDPGNRYTIPFHWGTSGILVRKDLVDRPITSWADLWDPAFAGKVGLWQIREDVIAIALKSQGLPINSEDPQHLKAAEERLLELRKNCFLLDNMEASIVPTLASGEAVIGYGWAYDAMLAKEQDLRIDYIIPQEGSILWSDYWVIPAASQNRHTAELFLDFILRPEISAKIISESYYPMANDLAKDYLDPEILQNPLVYPPEEVIKASELGTPLSVDGHQKYDAIWEHFLAAGPEGE